MNQELKNKIVNTLSQYKVKCSTLQIEIKELRSAMYQLSLIPNGIHLDLDKQLLDLQGKLNENNDYKSIQNCIGSLSNTMSALQKNKQNNRTLLTNLIKQKTELLGSIVVNFKDKELVDEIEQLIKDETDEAKLITQFTKLLEECINWVHNQLANQEQYSKPSTKESLQSSELTEQPFTRKINVRLNQLLEHLHIPEHLFDKLNTLKTNLEKQLTTESLLKIVDSLTDLVIEAFNLEHKQLKGFLNKFASHLREFGSYLKLSSTTNLQTKQDTKQLENDIQDNIQLIKNHIDNSQSIDELSSKIDSRLEMIGRQIKMYRENEQNRLQEYDKEIQILQEKLKEAEQATEEIKSQLSYQKVSINQDSLTGLPNRAAYDEYLLGAFHRWQNGFGELTLGLADIDHFKVINDSYGHLEGDKVLKKIAAIFKASIRTVDFIARYGGEEFIFIFERTRAEDAAKILEDLRNALEICDFMIRDTSVKISASFGLTALQQGDDLETLFIRTDEAMYQAKRSGRNQVVTF